MKCSIAVVDCNVADLAQSVERKAFNLVVVGSSPTVGDPFFFILLLLEGPLLSKPFPFYFGSSSGKRKTNMVPFFY